MDQEVLHLTIQYQLDKLQLQPATPIYQRLALPLR